MSIMGAKKKKKVFQSGGSKAGKLDSLMGATKKKGGVSRRASVLQKNLNFDTTSDQSKEDQIESMKDSIRASLKTKVTTKIAESTPLKSESPLKVIEEENA
jgi:hypothetical protein